MNKVNSLTRGGIYVALTICFVYLSSVLPTSKLSLMTIASAIIPFSILTTNVKTSISVYITSSLLCLLLSLRGMGIAYILFFGIYGIIKYYIERLRKPVIEYLLKIIFFNLCFYIIYNFATLIFVDLIKIKLSMFYIVIAMQIAFLVYDYALTMIISYMKQRLLKL